MPNSVYDVIVIGSGITGLTATKQLMESSPQLAVANIEAGLFGGLVINVNELDGKITGSGAELASNLMMETTDLGAVMLSEPVTAISEQAGKWVVTTAEAAHHARIVIVASGASLRRLGVPGEVEFEHKGVSQCADCDGPIYSGKDVVIAEGGDSALQEAHVLAGFCRRVHLVDRTDQFSAKQHLVDAIGKHGNVAVRHRTEVKAILGAEAVEKVQVLNLVDNTASEIACAGFFGFVGLKPSNDFVPVSIARDADGFLITDGSLKAGEGLFIAGAVRSGHGGMLEHAIVEGLAAADQAITALNEPTTIVAPLI
jgi:thioredoxin reductase (NADPH)